MPSDWVPLVLSLHMPVILVYVIMVQEVPNWKKNNNKKTTTTKNSNTLNSNTLKSQNFWAYKYILNLGLLPQYKFKDFNSKKLPGSLGWAAWAWKIIPWTSGNYQRPDCFRDRFLLFLQNYADFNWPTPASAMYKLH